MSSDHRLHAEKERLWDDFAHQLSKNVETLRNLAGKFRQGNSECYVLSRHRGSFNFSLRLHWQDGGRDWLIRFPIPGKVLFPDEKVQNEVVLMEFIRRNTSIPVPEIIGYGTAEENPTGLGPFIIMTWIEGVRMKDLLQETSASEKDPHDVKLNPDLSEDMLKSLYSEMSKVLCELWALDFDRIGSLVFDDSSNSWDITRRPLTIARTEMATRDGVSLELPGVSDTFSSSLDYFACLAGAHTIHLKKHVNGIRNSRDARLKYTTRHLFKSIIPFFTSMSENNGPFKLFCEDFGPGNVLVDPETLEITSVIDWEFCYAAPAQFLASPPRWLLLKYVDHWVLDEGLDSFLSAYMPKFELFLQTLEAHEAAEKNYASESVHPISTSSHQKLSTRMRESLESRQAWFNIAILEPFSIDSIYWDVLDNYVYGPASMTERTARTTGSSTCIMGGDKTYSLHRDREAFVRVKIADLQMYNVAIGKKTEEQQQVEYEEPAEDEKPEYWMRSEENEGEEEESSPSAVITTGQSGGDRWCHALGATKVTISHYSLAIKLSVSFAVMTIGVVSLQRKFLK